jgi:site-specific DNA recombinase
VVSQKRPFLTLPTRIERRARLVSAIARGRRSLEEIVSGSVTDLQQIATRQKCSVRQVNMTISLSFLAPDLVRAAVEGPVAARHRRRATS